MLSVSNYTLENAPCERDFVLQHMIVPDIENNRLETVSTITGELRRASDSPSV